MFLDLCLTLAMTLQGQATFKDDIGVIGIRRNVLSDVLDERWGIEWRSV